MSKTLEVGGLTFGVLRSNHRKTLGLTVDRGGELVIHAPETANDNELAQWTRSKLLWVHRKMAQKERLEPKVHEPEFVSGESFYYLGRPYPLKIIAQQDTPLRFDGTRFYLRNDAKTTALGCFRNWYISTAQEWINRRIAVISARIGSSPTRIQIGDLGFRWGSCGKNGVVYFNWRVMQFPVCLVDYVIAHELVHLQAPHHGLEFERVLDRSMPDWRARQEEMRMRAQVINWCFTTMW